MATSIFEQEEAFWQALEANPDDNDTRLVFADWLLEVKKDAVAYVLMRFMVSGWYIPGMETSNDIRYTKYYWASFADYPLSQDVNRIPTTLFKMLKDNSISRIVGHADRRLYYLSRYEADRDLMRVWVSFYSNNLLSLRDMHLESIPKEFRPINMNPRDLFKNEQY